MLHRLAAPLVLCVALVAPARAGDVSPAFGSRVTAEAGLKTPYLTSDLDGDGAVDEIYLVSVAPASKTMGLSAKTVVLSHFWSSKPLGGRGAKRALAILMGRDKGRFLITGYQGSDVIGFFESPIWGAKEKPMSIGKYKGKQALLVGTEAGIDTTLYWTGRSFALFEPAEEP
jgi:hypothetical protein